MAWLSALARHGPLASSFLLEFARRLGVSEKRARERLTDLFNEDNTPNKGAYLIRPPQQFHTLDSRYNQIVYDLSDAARRALKAKGVEPITTGGPWLHKFMVSSITASIDLVTRERENLVYIPQDEILRRAGATLSTQVSIKSKPTPVNLIPDALFGLKYKTPQGSRFRFFVVEADRATEPLTSKNFNRKSALRSLEAYHAYIAEGRYKLHLGLTSPLLVLNVFSDAARAEKVRELYGKKSPGGLSYQLFQAWEDFAPPFRPPKPNKGLLEGEWGRAGKSPIAIVNYTNTIVPKK